MLSLYTFSGIFVLANVFLMTVKSQQNATVSKAASFMYDVPINNVSSKYFFQPNVIQTSPVTLF